ncbi:MAG: DUF374 domain-containing protein [Bdellovibrionaceae bacterium]|nr:DUF374 domain-containing protein [Bdellovibrio sp.]
MSLSFDITYKKIRGSILGFLIWIIYRSLYYTWTIKVLDDEDLASDRRDNNTFILAHFHGDELALVGLTPQYRIATMTSTSKDGELMNAVLLFMGGRTSRGSSTRGGVSALKGLITLMKSGWNSSVAVDGPKGPLYEVKPGIFELSRFTKAKIYAGGVFCDRAWHFPKSWNKTYLPKPFAKIQVVWLGPIGPITKEDDPRSADLAKALQNQLFAARQHAGKLFGEP